MAISYEMKKKKQRTIQQILGCMGKNEITVANTEVDASASTCLLEVVSISDSSFIACP